MARPLRIRGYRFLAVALALTALLVAAMAAARAGQPEGPSFDTTSLLAEARKAAPYELKYPDVPVPGLELHNVIWGGADPDEAPNSSDFYADMWFLDGGGERLHIWQTNMQDVSNDPTVRENARPESVGGRIWMFERLELGDASAYQLSHRFPDGVLVTIDYYLDAEIIRAVAESLE